MNSSTPTGRKERKERATRETEKEETGFKLGESWTVGGEEQPA